MKEKKEHEANEHRNKINIMKTSKVFASQKITSWNKKKRNVGENTSKPTRKLIELAVKRKNL